MFAVGDEELSVAVLEASDVSELNSREFRQLQQQTEQYARETIVRSYRHWMLPDSTCVTRVVATV